MLLVDRLHPLYHIDIYLQALFALKCGTPDHTACECYNIVFALRGSARDISYTASSTAVIISSVGLSPGGKTWVANVSARLAWRSMSQKVFGMPPQYSVPCKTHRQHIVLASKSDGWDWDIPSSSYPHHPA